jgi:hypothetical protein
MMLLACLSGDKQVLSPSALASQAEIAFSEGLHAPPGSPESRAHFKGAFQALESLGHLCPGGAPYYLAKGNAALLAGNLPGAILAYWSGLRRAPEDKNLRGNLEYARSLVAYGENSFIHRPRLDGGREWLAQVGIIRIFGAGLALYCAGLIMFLSWWHGSQAWLLVGSLATLALAFLSFITIAYGAWLDNQDSEHPRVVICTDGLKLRKGNAESYPPTFDSPLMRGVEARLLFRRGDWLQIELASGRIGWVPAGAALKEQRNDEAIPHPEAS